MTLRLTDRDRRILAKCAICRWLPTRQIQQFYFPNATVNAVQKRLRKLADHGYLRIYRENLMSEALHGAGPAGQLILRERGIETVLTEDNPRQIKHLIGVNTIRFALEASKLTIAFFYAYWQLGSIGWTFPSIPDAICAIRTPTRRRFLIEFDRGTESVRVLVEKLRSYSDGIPGFKPDAVLLVTEQDRELERLRRTVQRERIEITCLSAALPELEQTPTGAVFVDLKDGSRRSLITSE